MAGIDSVPLPAREAATWEDRSPVDLVLSPDETRAVVVNQTSGSVSLVDLAAAHALAEVDIGKRPAAIAASADFQTFLVTATYSGDLVRLVRSRDQLQVAARIHLGFEPRGVALS
ncbi:MAG: hypothetical protein JNG90_11430, partial [Planctomycetaceae bacterium]|nr:hypothetical protein [Planctomycetaceae bacterium]